MKEIINKELLSLVVAEKVTNHGVENNELWYTIPKVFGHKILNLDTLGRLCKEWCTTKECALFSGWDYENGHYNALIARHETNDIVDNYGDTELEAIIKATEWVAKEKGIKDEH